MKITPDPQFKAHILKKIAEREFRERTGTHSSDLIFCLNKQAFRRLKPIEPTEEELLKYSLGWASQRWLTGSFDPEREYTVDGITVTPDVDEYPWELKATYQASTKAIEENPHWLRQIMAQCYVTGSTTAYLTRLEIMGNWKWVWHPGEKKIAEYIQEFGENWAAHPTLGAWKIEFTQVEVNANWAWMKVRKKWFEGILASGELVTPRAGVSKGQEWECDYCPYRRNGCDGINS